MKNISCRKIDGKNISNLILEYIVKDKEMCFTKSQPHISVIQVGNKSDSNIYIRKKQDIAKLLGFKFSYKNLSDTCTQYQLMEFIDTLKLDNTINGLIIQLPLPSHWDTPKILLSIPDTIDIEGLNSNHTSMLYYKKMEYNFIPCTAAACVSIIRYAGFNLQNLNVLILGSGLTAGRPCSQLLSACNSNVFLSNKTPLTNIDLDVIISAMGCKVEINPELIKEGSALINIGTYINEDGKLSSDIDSTEFIKKLSWISTSPGGIGPVTIAWLYLNLYESFRRSIGLNPITFPHKFLLSTKMHLFD